MKKIATLLFAITLILSLVACGAITTPLPNFETPTSHTEGNNAQAGIDSNDQSETDTSIQVETENNKGEINNNEISFTELVVVDNAECLIKITGIEPDNMFGFTLKAQLENKSADKTYMFSVVNAAINGVECDPFFASEVAAEKKSNERISFSNDQFKGSDIGNYTDIEITFRVYDSNDWGANDVARETVHVYPYGEDKAEKFVREAQASDNVIIDNEYVTVVVTGYNDDNIWGYTVNMFLINKTDTDVMFSIDEASVNGYMADPFYATTVSANKCKFSSVSWSNSTLEENDITDIEEIEFKFRIYNKNDWSGNNYANETITLNP